MYRGERPASSGSGGMESRRSESRSFKGDRGLLIPSAMTGRAACAPTTRPTGSISRGASHFLHASISSLRAGHRISRRSVALNFEEHPHAVPPVEAVFRGHREPHSIRGGSERNPVEDPPALRGRIVDQRLRLPDAVGENHFHYVR